jgi:hypothetical protein
MSSAASARSSRRSATPLRSAHTRIGHQHDLAAGTDQRDIHIVRVGVPEPIKADRDLGDRATRLVTFTVEGIG